MEDYEDSVTRKGVEENLKMMPLKALKGNISDVTNIHFHILLTKEDDVIVARCLDFSISSHGENEKEALLSLSDSIKDYLDYAIKECALAACRRENLGCPSMGQMQRVALIFHSAIDGPAPPHPPLRKGGMGG